MLNGAEFLGCDPTSSDLIASCTSPLRQTSRGQPCVIRNHIALTVVGESNLQGTDQTGRIVLVGPVGCWRHTIVLLPLLSNDDTSAR